MIYGIVLGIPGKHTMHNALLKYLKKRKEQEN
jgi:hypothetical protein